MNDLTMTKLCAQAMGWKHLGAVGVPLTPDELQESPTAIDRKHPGRLWCLSGHNDWWQSPNGESVCQPCYGSVPDPLNDDAQAMALVKLLRLWVSGPVSGCSDWMVTNQDGCSGRSGDLNRAIVECVAQMQATTAKA